MAKNKTLEQYRAEARGGAFVLEVSDTESITIPVPDGETFLDLGEVAANDARGMLELLCGEQYDDVMTVLGSEPATVMFAVIQDMLRTFGITDVGNAPGGSRASRR